MKFKKILKWAWIILFIYTGMGAALYFFQEKILFHPQSLSPGYVYHFNIPFREINIAVNGNKNISLVQFTVPDSACRGIVLYFHGNRKNITRYAPFAVNFTKNGYETWMIDYPGFGKSTGKLTEKTLYENALLVYKMALHKFPADSIIIYGKSLGTGIAAQLASIRDCKRLILETPYYSVTALASHYFFIYPVMLMSKFSIPSYLYIENTRAPVTIFHGSKDEVIPYKQARRLAAKKPGTELITISGGKHNNLNDYPIFHQKLDSLLQH